MGETKIGGKIISRIAHTLGITEAKPNENAPSADMPPKVIDAGTPTAVPSGIMNARTHTAGSTLRAGGFAPTPEIQDARHGGPKTMAEALHGLATKKLFANEDKRLDQMKELFEGKNTEDIELVRRAYIKEYGADPELHIRSWGVAQPLAPFSDATVKEMVRVLNGPRIAEIAQSLVDLETKARAGTLTHADRNDYFAMMPMMGLWNPPTRPEAGKDLDSLERSLLKDALGAHDLDATMRAIESALPKPDLTTNVPRERCIAVVASSAGAQWQELMGWAVEMADKGYHLQVFTPDGKPVAFQKDSLCVNPLELGFGSPIGLDPAGNAGRVAAKILGNTASAAQFDPKQFGAVYCAGGLGFNEDVAVSRPVQDPGEKKPHSEITVNANVKQMLESAIAEKLPQIAICHGPTVYAGVDIEVNGTKEPLAKGVSLSALGPFEGVVELTRRKEVQFTWDTNTHDTLRRAGAEVHPVKDTLNTSRFVVQEKAGVWIATGSAPPAADELARETEKLLRKRWG